MLCCDASERTESGLRQKAPLLPAVLPTSRAMRNHPIPPVMLWADRPVSTCTVETVFPVQHPTTVKHLKAAIIANPGWRYLDQGRVSPVNSSIEEETWVLQLYRSVSQEMR